MICLEEIERVRRDRDRKQAVAWGLVDREQKKCLYLKRMLVSFAGWEEA